MEKLISKLKLLINSFKESIGSFQNQLKSKFQVKKKEPEDNVEEKGKEEGGLEESTSPKEILPEEKKSGIKRKIVIVGLVIIIIILGISILFEEKKIIKTKNNGDSKVDSQEEKNSKKGISSSDEGEVPKKEKGQIYRVPPKEKSDEKKEQNSMEDEVKSNLDSTPTHSPTPTSAPISSQMINPEITPSISDTISDILPTPPIETPTSQGSQIVENNNSTENSSDLEFESDPTISKVQNEKAIPPLKEEKILKLDSIVKKINKENKLSREVASNEDQVIEKEKDNIINTPIPDKVMPPSYNRKGRGLVYSCSRKHWACVDRESYFQCQENQNWAKMASLGPDCVIAEVYTSLDDCIEIQKLKVSDGKNIEECLLKK